MSDKIKLPAAKQLTAVVRLLNENKTKSAGIAQESSSRVKEFTENGNGHGGVTKLLAKLDRMEELSRLTFLSHFRHGLEVFEKKWEKEGHTGNLVDQAENEADEAEQEAATRARENAERIEQGIKPLNPDQELEKGAPKEEAAPPPPPGGATITPLKVGGARGRGVGRRGEASAH
jgi:hypothetical protein